MNFINDILDSDQLCSISNFVCSTEYRTMIWYGTGNNGKSVLSKTIPNRVFIDLNTFNNNTTFSKHSIFILNEMDSHSIQDIRNIIHYIRHNYQQSKLLIITNNYSLPNLLTDDTTISIFFKYQFVKHINEPNDKLVNPHILDQIDTNNLWIKV